MELCLCAHRRAHARQKLALRCGRVVRPLIGAVVFALALVLSQRASAQDTAQGFTERGPRFLLAMAGTQPAARLDVARTPVLRRRLSLDFDSIPLGEALGRIAREAGLKLAFSNAVLPLSKPVHLKVDDITVAAALTELLVDADVDVLFSTNSQAVLSR